MNNLKKIIDFIVSWKFIGPIVYIIIGFILYRFIIGIINKIKSRRKSKSNHKKEDTVINLIKNIIKYIIIIIVVLMILELYGVNTTSIIASLGIVGVVVGLAFQDTIKNMLAGILIIYDNRYNVGDFVKINDFTGTVKNLGLQTTKIQAYTGEVFTISNSNINTVINYSESNSRVLLSLSVSYNTDINKLEKVLSKLNNKIKKIDNVVGNLELLGLDAFNSSDMSYMVTVLCKPNTHYAVKRSMLRIIKEEFDKEGIEIPYTQIDLHVVEDKTNIDIKNNN